MTEEEIQAFLAAANTGTISAAAKRLFITQPALSRRINTLEEQLGYSLFLRHKGVRAIELTAEGKAFIPLAERWQALFNESQTLGKNMDQRKLFNLGVINSMSTYILPSTLRQFINDNPECQFNIHQYHSPECYQHVEDGSLDMALIANERYSKEILCKPVFKTHFLLVSQTALGDKNTVHPSELDVANEIRIPWGSEFDIWHDYWFGSISQSRVNLDLMSILEYFITDSDIWAVVPAYIATYLQEKYQLHVYQLQVPPPDIFVYYLQRKGQNSPYNQKFLQIILEQLKDRQDITLLL